MKKIICIATAVLFAAVVSCEKETEKKIDKITESLCREWYLSNEAVDMEVYMNFNPDGTFELYQRLGTSSFTHFKGTWNLDGETLSGKYSDGQHWGASYQVAFYDKFMTLTSMTEIQETYTYTEKSVPDELKAAISNTKSIDSKPIF